MEATHWARAIGAKITDISKGTSEILARLAEPFMRYATIYLALATGIAVLKWEPLYQGAQGIVIAAPEFVLLGALTVAERAIKGKNFYGYLLALICLALFGIMVATFVDIFIVHFDEMAIKLLNFSRCIVAVGFSIVLGKLEDADQAQSKETYALVNETAEDITEASKGQEDSRQETPIGQPFERKETPKSDSKKDKRDTADTRCRILDYQKRHPHVTQKDMAAALGVSLKTVQRHLRAEPPKRLQLVR